MDTTALQEAKVRATELESHWIRRNGRRLFYMILEALGYVVALGLVVLLFAVVGMGHSLLVDEATNGHTRVSTYLTDDRVTLLLYATYLVLFLFALCAFVIARMLRSARKRREQVHQLCAAVGRI